MKLPIGPGKLTLQALLILATVASYPCRADTIYSNLGPGNTWIVNRDYQTNFDLMATSFVTTGSGDLGDILTPLFSLNNPVSLGLYTDSAGKPGSLLEDWSVNAPGIPGLLTTIPSVKNPFLSAATQYWLVIDLTDAQKNALAWYQNNQGIDGGVWAGNSLTGLIGFESGMPAPAIQLDSTTGLPEPASRLLLWIGLPLLVAARRIAIGAGHRV